MKPLLLWLVLAAPWLQTPSSGRTAATHPVAQRPAQNPKLLAAIAVVDSLIKVPVPRSLPAAHARTWRDQTTWFKSLKDRMTNLLSMVVAPAKEVETPAPVDDKNIKALQEEAEKESLRFALTQAQLKARQEVAMTAIRNIR